MKFSNEVLTTDENRIKIYSKIFKVQIQNVNQIPKIGPISYETLKNKDIAKGNLLSNLPWQIV